MNISTSPENYIGALTNLLLRGGPPNGFSEEYGLFAYNAMDIMYREFFTMHFLERRTITEISMRKRIQGEIVSLYCGIGLQHFSNALAKLRPAAENRLRTGECYRLLEASPEDSDEFIHDRRRELSAMHNPLLIDAMDAGGRALEEEWTIAIENAFGFIMAVRKAASKVGRKGSSRTRRRA